MHLILRGLYGKHGCTNTMSKDWLYVVYSIYSGRDNDIDLIEVLWKDFPKFALKRKPNEISSSRLWALTLEQLYDEGLESIPLNSDLKEVCYSFKAIKTYRLPNQFTFKPICCLPQHMLAAVSSDSLYLKHYLATSVVYEPTQCTPISYDQPSDVNKPIFIGGRKKKMAKQKASP